MRGLAILLINGELDKHVEHKQNKRKKMDDSGVGRIDIGKSTGWLRRQ